ncbi:unnamed protein product [Kluyveromyces dobzhanskii CBS 2104]|uniref:WGS project CCBQ000000000 data, contig 00102 n=1 Tax=Kluyveromyces dobzhanskii CBS 2104 TaxID=1427455 RepID=A0A0A8L4J8_9SACH|nr:unnamed protein product [Kluyveromyces dobzhanskii CBS 2104]
MTRKLSGNPNIGFKEQIVRKRTPKSCIRCYSIKRKCDHAKPFCTRCMRKGLTCEYFTEEHVLERCLQRQNKRLTAVEQGVLVNPRDSKSNVIDEIAPNTELNPMTRDSEAKNFKLILNSTGEYSKYLSLCLFPFSDPSQNVSYIVDRLPRDQDKYVVFDFSYVPNRLSSPADVKNMLPSKLECDMLVSHFFNNISPFIPILNKEEFELKYNDIWKNLPTYDDLNTLMVLYAVMFCSCVTIQVSNVYLTGRHYTNEDPIDYDKLKYTCFQCVENIKYMNSTNISPSMSAITALTLMYYVGSLNCNGVAGEVATLVRYCQIAGLHRSLSQDTSVSSVRSFLYSYVVHLDSLSSYYNGLTSYINTDLFETVRNFPKPEKDLKTLFTLTKLYNTVIWISLLHQLNKIEASVEEDFVRLSGEYLRSEEKVNLLNSQIMGLFPEVPEDYKMLLVVEGRLGIRKSAILVHFLRLSVADVNMKTVHKGENYNYNLVMQALLLINESLVKIRLGVMYNPALLWWVRNSYPFQALTIVLTHLQKSPTIRINFDNLPVGMEYSRIPDINYSAFDVREELVVKAINAIHTIKPTWPIVIQTRFEKVCDLKNYVFSQRKHQQSAPVSSTMPTLPTPIPDFNAATDPAAATAASTAPKMTFDELLSSLFDSDKEFQSFFLETLPQDL